MLYGHIETVEDRVDHLLRLRDLQDETGGFVTFIPLAFQPWEAPSMRLPETTGFEDLKAIAVSRLLLDNFPHIEAYWVMIGEATASLALHFGASDVNGTLEDEKIAHMAQAASPAGLATEQILRIVRDAGKIPVERDALYNVVKVWS
jgi:aminodeoxyfutalosine synthase